MITDRVQVQFALETGVRVDDLQLDRTVAMIAEQNRLSLADFRRALEREGVPFDKFREDIRREIMISGFSEREVDSKIQIGESEIDNFLEEMQSTPQATEYNIAHVLVRVPESATPEQVEARMKRAQEALARARRRRGLRAGRSELLRRARRPRGREHGLARAGSAAGAVLRRRSSR